MWGIYSDVRQTETLCIFRAKLIINLGQIYAIKFGQSHLAAPPEVQNCPYANVKNNTSRHSCNFIFFI